MKRNNLSPTKGSVYLIAFVAIAVVVIYTGCESDTNKNGNAERTLTGPSPSPSPTPSSTPKERILPGDTIIVIKDGSVHIKPNKDPATVKCEDDGSTAQDKKYKCNVLLGEMGIQTTNGPTIVATNERSVILINEGDDEIRIEENGSKAKIKFKKSRYETCTDDPDEDCSIFTANRVRKITVDTPAFSKVCQPTDKCEVFVRKR